APLALLLGVAIVGLVIGIQRADLASIFHIENFDLARSSHYVAMGTALLLPALAVAANAIVHRWRQAAPLVLLPFLVGVPANVDAFSSAATLPLSTPAFYEWQRAFVTGVADSPVAKAVPRDVHPYPNELATANLDVGFIRTAKKLGRLPDSMPRPRA